MASSPPPAPPGGPIPAANTTTMVYDGGLEVSSRQEQFPKYSYQEPVYAPQLAYPGQPGYQQIPYAGSPGINQLPYPQPEKEKRILGLKRPIFFLSLVLLLAIIGVAVGGGVGISAAINNAKTTNNSSGNGTDPAAATSTGGSTSSSKPTPTTTGAPLASTASPGVISPPATGTLAWPYPCPTSTQTVSLIGQQWTFGVACGVDYSVYVDIAALTVFSFEDCMRACASMTRNALLAGANAAGPKCAGVEFNVDQTFEVQANGGNCWLKNTTAGAFLSGQQTGDVTSGGAVLIKTP